MPFNLGDGAVLKISIRDGTTQSEAVKLFLDPAHIRAHRAWIPVRFEVPAGMEHFRLLLEVTAGARGEYTGDWVGLAAGNESGCLLAAPSANPKSTQVAAP